MTTRVVSCYTDTDSNAKTMQMGIMNWQKCAHQKKNDSSHSIACNCIKQKKPARMYDNLILCKYKQNTRYV